MSELFQRVRGVFKRKPRTQQPPPDPIPNPTRGETLGTIKKPDDQTDDDDDIGSVRSYDPLQEIPSGTQARNAIPSADNIRNANAYQSEPSTPQTRGTSNGFGTGLPSNNNMNADTVPISNPPPRANLPFPSQTQDPSSRPPLNPVSPPANNPEPSTMNLHQTVPHATNPIPQSSLGGTVPRGLNLNQPSLQINPNSNLVGFPPGRHSHINQRSQFLSAPFSAHQEYFRQRNRLPLSARLPSFRPRNDRARFEVDYPIENVIIDENIPSSLAIKVNEAVEHDRFGNAYYTHRYAYEPASQQISIGNNRQIQRRLIGNSHQSGTRHIREITNENYYPQRIQTDDYNDLQLIFEDTPQLSYPIISSQYNPNSFPSPVYHYIACALPNDPMQNY